MVKELCQAYVDTQCAKVLGDRTIALDITEFWHSDDENLAKNKILKLVQQGLRTKRSSSLSAGTFSVQRLRVIDIWE